MKKAICNLTVAVILATHFASTMADAQSDKQSGKRRGPPPQAIEACADVTEGAACSFAGRRGEVTGTCIVPREDQDELACAPAVGPPRDHGERNDQEN